MTSRSTISRRPSSTSNVESNIADQKIENVIKMMDATFLSNLVETVVAMMIEMAMMMAIVLIEISSMKVMVEDTKTDDIVEMMIEIAETNTKDMIIKDFKETVNSTWSSTRKFARGSTKRLTRRR